MGNIQYLQQQQVDKIKWDQCIGNAANGLVYAYSFYLDAMAKHWDALVLGDYEAVMPLTWNKKYGVQYLYQPPFAAALGVFGKQANRLLKKLFLKNGRAFGFMELITSRNSLIYKTILIK